MNQILITKEEKGGSMSGIKPIVIFFAVVIIIISLIFIGQGAFHLYKNMKDNNDYAKPLLTAEKNGSAVSIKVTGEIGINKIEYSWNNGSTTVLKCEGRKSVNPEIEMPQGDNKLNIVVIDVEGNKTKFADIPMSFNEDEDTVKPKIAIVNAVGKLKVTATDETEIAYLTYQWEDGEEVKVEKTEENSKSITQEISVQKGTKKLTITAVDKTGNKETLVKKIIGSNGPEIKVTASDGNFIVKVTDENGITKIEYTHNEQVSTVNNIPAGAKEYEFKVQLKDGVNYLKVNAYENDLMTEFKCKKTK